jgi:hypothetical protein
MSSRDGAVFMNKYERLNQDLVMQDSDDDNDPDYVPRDRNVGDDLLLDEEVEFGYTKYQQNNPGLVNNVVMDGLQTSTLFYEQDGWVLMRLPRDQVRLIMDPDLEPGILSVEQWRTREDVERQQRRQRELEAAMAEGIDPLKTRGGGQALDADGGEDEEFRMPELHYVMTVPDDLYQRVIDEINMEAFPPYWGFFKFCNQESERADIKLALAILSVFFLLIFLGSVEWEYN